MTKDTCKFQYEEAVKRGDVAAAEFWEKRARIKGLEVKPVEDKPKGKK